MRLSLDNGAPLTDPTAKGAVPEKSGPSGVQQKLSNVRADQILQIDEPAVGASPK
jgi:hypothetical protein